MIESTAYQKEPERKELVTYDIGAFYLPRQKEDGTDDQYCDSFFVNPARKEAGIFDGARHGFTQKWAGKLAKTSFMYHLDQLNREVDSPSVRDVVQSLQFGWESGIDAIKWYHDKPNAKFKNYEAMDMATTATVMKIIEKKGRQFAIVAHGGDTKFLAAFPNGSVKQTRDQAYIYHMERAGRLTEAQATTIEDLISNGIDTTHSKDALVDPLGNHIIPRDEDQKAVWVMRGAQSIKTYVDMRQFLENCIYDDRLYIKPGEKKIGIPELYLFDVTDAEFFAEYSDGIGDNFLQKILVNRIRSAIARGMSASEIAQDICFFARQNAANPHSAKSIRDDETFILGIPQPKIPA